METKDLKRAATPNITYWCSEGYRLLSLFYLFVALLLINTKLPQQNKVSPFGYSTCVNVTGTHNSFSIPL